MEDEILTTRKHKNKGVESYFNTCLFLRFFQSLHL